MLRQAGAREADELVVDLCFEGGFFGVLADDSDYAVVSDIPAFFPLSALRVSPGGELAIRVIQPEALAQRFTALIREVGALVFLTVQGFEFDLGGACTVSTILNLN